VRRLKGGEESPGKKHFKSLTKVKQEKTKAPNFKARMKRKQRHRHRFHSAAEQGKQNP